MANRQIEIIVKEEGMSSTSDGSGANAVAQIQMNQTEETRSSAAISQSAAIGFMMAKNIGNQMIGKVGNITGSSEIQANINDAKQAIGWGVALLKFPKIAIPALAIQAVMHGFEENQRVRLETHSIELNTIRGGFDRTTHTRSKIYD